jgi:hypothetical protein
MFGDPTLLKTVFNFYYTPPPWAKVPSSPSLFVVDYTENIEDVLSWIKTSRDASAVLVPCNLFGPDIMLRCRVASGDER